MSNTSEQRLVLLKVIDPGLPADITPQLEKLAFWGEGWTIQNVSVAAYGENGKQAMVAVVLTREIPATLTSGIA